MKRPGELWRPVGWRVVSPRGVVCYDMQLPAAGRAMVERDKPGKPWRYNIGDRETATGRRKWTGRYKTAAAAARACEIEILRECRAFVRLVKSAATR